MAHAGWDAGQRRNIQYNTNVRTDLRLMEVDESLLPEIMATGVVIKGGHDDEAVLCTATKTFALKLVETSNLQLLVPPAEEEVDDTQQQDVSQYAPALGDGLQTQLHNLKRADARPPIVVTATNCSQIELVEVAPRLDVLRAMLQQRRYGQQQQEDDAQGGLAAAGGADGGEGRADDAMDVDGGGRAKAQAGASSSGGGGGGVGYPFQELMDRVQASAGELLAALSVMGALEVCGRWCLLDEAYLGGLLELLILTAQQEGLPLHALRLGTLSAALEADGYPAAVVAQCLRLYATPVSGEGSGAAAAVTGDEPPAGGAAAASGSDGGEAPAPAPTWALDEKKVCTYFAHKVLGRRPWALPDFMREWAAQVPYGVQPSMAMLKGEVLLEGDGHISRITSFPACRLPRDPAKRFAALFATRPRWAWTDLEPYLADLKVPGMSVEALLLKYARGSQQTPEAPLIYSAR